MVYWRSFYARLFLLWEGDALWTPLSEHSWAQCVAPRLKGSPSSKVSPTQHHRSGRDAFSHRNRSRRGMACETRSPMAQPPPSHRISHTSMSFCLIRPPQTRQVITYIITPT